VNCWVVPGAIDAVLGVTAIETNDGVTVKAAVPLIDPELAVIVAVPGASPVANPVCLPTLATDSAEEVHVAEVVRFCVVPLL